MGFYIERIFFIIVFSSKRNAKVKERERRKKRFLENQIV